MRRLINGLTGWSVICAAILILASPVAAAPSEKGGASPEKGAPSEAAEPKAPPATAAAGEIQSPVKVKDILAEGFLIRTTVLVPADAVTRQLGKVSPDAVILTLQKETQSRFAITRSRLM
jgi:hypothetical protein